MTPVKASLAPAAVLAAAALAVVAWRCRRSASAAEAGLAVAAKEQAALDARLGAVRADARADAEDRAKLSAALAAARSGAAATGPGGPAAAPSSSEPQSHRSLASLLASHPRLLELYLQSYRANLAVHFGGLYRKMGLTEAQVASFEDAMTASAAEMIELRAAAEDQGLPMSDPGIVAMQRKDAQQLRQAVSAATGATPAQIFQYDRNAVRASPVQNLVNNLDYYAAANSDPLTYQQASQLKQIMAATSPAYQAGGRASPESVNWAAASAQAAGILSPTQLQAMQTEGQVQTLSNLVKRYYSEQRQQASATGN